MSNPPDQSEMQSIVAGIDHLVAEMERRWGVGRLRLLVGDDLRAKFDRQVSKLGEALDAYDLAAVRVHGPAMVRAWQALDRAATDAGARPLEPVVWEVRLADGTVAAIVRSTAEAHAVALDGRQGQIWTLEEIARVIDRWPEIGRAKATFPGAIVTDIRDRRRAADLNDELPW